MTAPNERLAQLHAEYDALKPEVDELTKRLKSITDGIKAEALAYQDERVTAGSVPIETEGYRPLVLRRKDGWRLDSRALKAADPVTYALYAIETHTWELRPQ